LVAEEFKDDIEAFEEFCAYRNREEGRSGDTAVTRDEWLECERPPAKAGGFGLRLKAGSIGHSAD
jgi:hypothetical protein